LNRIAIVGCGGSGKSTVARQLGKLRDIPVTHLDALYYDGDWTPLPMDDFAAAQAELVAEPRWIIEGNYASTLHIRVAAADMVVFLDLPARTCLRGILQRRLRYRGGQHADHGVYDRITWDFVRYIIGYRRSMAPRVRALVTEHGPDAALVTLKSRRQVRRFLAQGPAA
jgi:adenylate kinase family enzyme